MPYTDEEILSLDRIKTEIAAEYLAASPEFIRLGLIQRTLPIGAAVWAGKQWSYNISPGLLVAYKRGTLHMCVNAEPEKV